MGLLPYSAFNLECSCFIFIDCNMLVLFLCFFSKRKFLHLEEILSFCNMPRYSIYCQFTVSLFLITISEGAAAAAERQ